jgi:hypothetical protein
MPWNIVLTIQDKTHAMIWSHGMNSRYSIRTASLAIPVTVGAMVLINMTYILIVQ